MASGVADYTSGVIQKVKPVRKGIALAIVSGRATVPVEMIPALCMQSWPTNINMAIITRYGMSTDEGRISAVKDAQALGSKYIWFVDDDTVPPIDAGRHLVYLLEQNANVMVAGGIYTTRVAPPEPIVYMEPGAGSHWDWKVGETFKCWGLGTGCMMINMEVFDHIEQPWFKTTMEADKKQTDDLYFCERVHAAGFDIMAHGGILCHHYDLERGTIYQLPRNSKPYQNRIEGQFRETELALNVAPQVDVIPNPWMTYPETLWLIDRARNSKAFAEVGCWKGITTRNVAVNAPDCKIYAFDHFQGSKEHRDPNSLHFEPALVDDTWLVSEFNKTIKGLRNVSAAALTSRQAALSWPDGSFDTVFIDASHEYEDVKRDILAWLPLVKDGGTLCGHDYDAVRAAVHEVLPGAQLVGNTSIWHYVKGK